MAKQAAGSGQRAATKPKAKGKPKPKKLTVAVTGPTGDIGIAALRALDSSPRSAR